MSHRASQWCVSLVALSECNCQLRQNQSSPIQPPIPKPARVICSDPTFSDWLPGSAASLTSCYPRRIPPPNFGPAKKCREAPPDEVEVCGPLLHSQVRDPPLSELVCRQPVGMQLLQKIQIQRGVPPQLLPEYFSSSVVALLSLGCESLQLFTCITRATLHFTVRDKCM